MNFLDFTDVFLSIIVYDKENKLIEEWLKDPNAHGYNVWTAPRLQEKIKVGCIQELIAKNLDFERFIVQLGLIPV